MQNFFFKILKNILNAYHKQFLKSRSFHFFLTCTKICIFFTRQLARFFGLNISACLEMIAPLVCLVLRYIQNAGMSELGSIGGIPLILVNLLHMY